MLLYSSTSDVTWSDTSVVDASQVLVEPLADAEEGISVVTLNRPEAKNALGRQMVRELQESIDTLRQEPTTRCVVIRSLVSGCFSAGADLKVCGNCAYCAETSNSCKVCVYSHLHELPCQQTAVHLCALFPHVHLLVSSKCAHTWHPL